jgi:general secretion pathway protein G
MELLIVIAILLAIGGIVVVNLLPAKDQADIDLTQSQIDQIERALKMFKLNLNRWPTEEEGLSALWSKTGLDEEEDEASWQGPYLEKPIREDPWGAAYVYHAPSEKRDGAPYDIISFGPDGEEDTEDDIHNHLRDQGEGGEFDNDEFEFTTGEGDRAG